MKRAKPGHVLKGFTMLHKLQNQMSDFIQAKSDDVVSDIISPDAIARLKVYRNNYFGNLCEALKITYPMFCKLVGDEFFEFCARSYIKANPPTSGHLLEYGRDFHEFIARFPQTELYPYFSELIKFECLLDISHNAEEGGAWLKASVHLMQSVYDISEVFEFCEAQDTDRSLQINEGKYFFLIYRENYVVKYRSISKAFYHFLQNLPNSQGEKPMLREARKLGILNEV